MGRVTGHRGRSGELTVRVFRGDAAFWQKLSRVWIGRPDIGKGKVYPIESSRSYRDRLVLKLEGVDEATLAARLRGERVMARFEDAPELPPGQYYTAVLVGMEVRDEKAGRIGRVRDVMPTGGTDLLVVERGDAAGEKDAGGDEEVLIPLTGEIVLDVDREKKNVRVRLPDGLLELNRKE